MEEEVLWCLWIGETDTDYVLCNGDIDLLPNLYEKDEIRYEYNQWNQERSRVSCTIFSAIGMLSDLINYEFNLNQIKEADDLSYDNPKYFHIRRRWEWWYVKDAVECVKDWYNSSELAKKYWKVAFYRINKYDDEILEWVIDKLYTINWNHWLNSEYTKDKADWMIDWTDFWFQTSGHAVDIIRYNWQRSVKNSYKWVKNNIYWLKHQLSKISNFGNFFYVYTLVKEDNLERVKKLNEMKAKIVNGQQINSDLWNLSWSKVHKDKLHDMNNFYREWVAYIDSELKTLV